MTGASTQAGDCQEGGFAVGLVIRRQKLLVGPLPTGNVDRSPDCAHTLSKASQLLSSLPGLNCCWNLIPGFHASSSYASCSFLRMVCKVRHPAWQARAICSWQRPLPPIDQLPAPPTIPIHRLRLNWNCHRIHWNNQTLGKSVPQFLHV